MPVQKNAGTAPIVARGRTAPVGVVARDAAGVGGIVAGVVEDPAARFFRRTFGDTLKRIAKDLLKFSPPRMRTCIKLSARIKRKK